MKVDHFYIHIPFCNQKCPYCKFALTPIYTTTKIQRYLAYLRKEIITFFRENPESSTPNNQKTIYFWGGTPSILTPSDIQEILKCFPFYPNQSIEITLEANPEDITKEYVENIIDLGINRISLGVQTLSDISLKEIHRCSRKNIIEALSVLDSTITMSRKNISLSVDFILWLPYVRAWDILKNIQEVHSCFSSITHTSVYLLEDEKYPKHWRECSIAPRAIQQEYLDIVEYFEEKNWNHYEISNFSISGYECKHNRSYWNHSNYKGFGLSAASFIETIRRENSPSFSGYYAGKYTEEYISSDAKILEAMMFWLRTFHWKLPKNIQTDNPKIQEYISNGWVTLENNTLQLTKTWIFLADYIMAEIVEYL